MKTGLLLAASGTGDPSARRALDAIGERAAQRFSGLDIRWSYTSEAIRRKLAREGRSADSPADALRRLRDGGCTHVAVGCFHVIAGMEYDELKDTVATFAHGPDAFAGLALGKPLLGSYDDLLRAATALLAGLPAQRTRNDAVVLVGHGNDRHPGDLAYIAAAHVFRELDPHVFLGTVRSHPSLAGVVRECLAAGVGKAYLLPFTTVAGRTTRDVMTGGGADSWSSALSRSGIEPVPVFKGLAEYPDVAAIWLDHLSTAIRELGEGES